MAIHEVADLAVRILDTVKMIDAIEIDTLARTIWGEARGEDILGRVAVALVIMNRVNADLWQDDKPDWWGESIIGCCKKKHQFSCWNEEDVNYGLVIRVGRNDPVFPECIAIAELAGKGLLQDPTKGATHYHAVDVKPSWVNGQDPSAVIGNHLFYNRIEEGLNGSPAESD